MKFQPRRFVVEVKRGTSRAAFTSPDTVSDKFSSAEAMLFGSPRSTDPLQPKHDEAHFAKPGGRILNSLVEPEPAMIEDVIERPRRGRKPGSKNKPKIPTIVATTDLGTRQARGTARAPQQRGFSEDAPSWRDHVVPPSPAPESSPPSVTAQADDAAPRGARRIRLRERSSIIKRYVLGMDPRPGDAGSSRARRAARAAR